MKHGVLVLAVALLATGGGRGISSRFSTPYRFASGYRASRIPFEEDDGHIFIKIRINESGPLWFGVDTGAIHSVIDAERARVLGLHAEGTQQVGGAGGTEEAGIVKGVSIKLPGVELVDQSLWTLSLSAIAAAHGRPMDGIIGYDLFRGLVVDVDYEQERLDICEAASYSYGGSGESIPLALQDDGIYVRGKVTSQSGSEAEGDFIIDTGSSNTLMLAKSFVEEHRLWPPARSAVTVRGGGVGGTLRLLIGRVKKLQLGRFTVANPVTAFVETGEITEPGKAGNIGARLLRRFRVIFDYSRRRMILEPTSRAEEPEEFDMSGAGLVSQGPDFRTIRVVGTRPGSPAAEAGLKAEDVITGVDCLAAELSLSRLKHLFRKEGRGYVLSVKRGGHTIRLTLRTRRMV